MMSIAAKTWKFSGSGLAAWPGSKSSLEWCHKTHIPEISWRLGVSTEINGKAVKQFYWFGCSCGRDLCVDESWFQPGTFSTSEGPPYDHLWDQYASCPWGSLASCVSPLTVRWVYGIGSCADKALDHGLFYCTKQLSNEHGRNWIKVLSFFLLGVAFIISHCLKNLICLKNQLLIPRIKVSNSSKELP